MSQTPPENPYGDQPPPPPYGQQPGQPYAQQPGQPYPPQGQPTGGSGLAITALVFGILALITFWTVIGGILFGVIALIVGFIASGKAKRGTAKGRGMAITGIVLGLLGAVLSIVFIAVGISIFNSNGGKNYADCVNNANGDQAQIQKCAEEFSRNLTN